VTELWNTLCISDSRFFWDRLGYDHLVILLAVPRWKLNSLKEIDTFCVRLGCFQFKAIFSELLPDLLNPLFKLEVVSFNDTFLL
jgi:hypothetical protein